MMWLLSQEGTDSGSWKLFQRWKYHLPPSLKPDVSRKLCNNINKMKKEAEKLYLVDSIFLNSFRPFQNCIHTKRHISDTSPSNIPTLWYEVWKASKLDFFGVEEKERWMCRYEASRPALSRDLACGHPPAQQNPSPEHSSQDRSTKLSKQKRFCVLHVNGALDEISSEDECGEAALSSPANGYVPLDLWQSRVRRIIQA